MKEKLKGAKVTAKLTAGISITPDWKASAGWEKDPRGWWHGPTFTFDFKATATLKASVKGEIGIAYKHQTEKKELLSIESKTCVWVYVVAFCPKLTVHSQLTLDGSIQFTFESTYQRTMGGRLWRAADTSLHKQDLTTNPTKTFKHELKAQAKITADFPVALEILIYKVVGPSLRVTPSLVLDAVTNKNPWLNLDLNLKVDVAFIVDFKIKRFEWGKTVYNNKFHLWDSGGPLKVPSLSPAVTHVGKQSGTAKKTMSAASAAGDPIQLTVQWPDNCDGREATWSMVEGSLGTVTQDGRYTPPSPLPEGGFVDQVQAETEGTSTCPANKAHAAVHYGPSLPGEPLNVRVSQDGKKITWSPPRDQGNEKITEYIVLLHNDPDDPESSEYVLDSSTENSLTVPADDVAELIQSGVQVSVVAVNDRGAGPPSDLS